MSRWRGTVAALACAGVVVVAITVGGSAAIHRDPTPHREPAGARHSGWARVEAVWVADAGAIHSSPTALEDALGRLFAVLGLAAAGVIVSGRIRRTPMPPAMPRTTVGGDAHSAMGRGEGAAAADGRL